MLEDAFRTTVDVRFRDLDTMGHVNNALYATYLEEARSAYYREVIGESLPDVDTVLAHLSIEYRAPIELGETVTVVLIVPEVGESSIPMEYEIRTDDSLAATAETVQVVWNREDGGSKPVPDRWRERIESFEQSEGAV